jgi:hypothetical protein
LILCYDYSHTVELLLVIFIKNYNKVVILQDLWTID